MPSGPACPVCGRDSFCDHFVGLPGSMSADLTFAEVLLVWAFRLALSDAVGD